MSTDAQNLSNYYFDAERGGMRLAFAVTAEELPQAIRKANATFSAPEEAARGVFVGSGVHHTVFGASPDLEITKDDFVKAESVDPINSGISSLQVQVPPLETVEMLRDRGYEAPHDIDGEERFDWGEALFSRDIRFEENQNPHSQPDGMMRVEWSRRGNGKYGFTIEAFLHAHVEPSPYFPETEKRSLGHDTIVRAHEGRHKMHFGPDEIEEALGTYEPLIMKRLSALFGRSAEN